MNENPLISIIIPIYNAEKTIGKMIDSIIQQKFKDYELILVNDGSKDNTLSILNEYKKNNDKITIIDKVNTGVSDTRNQGLKIAKGKYIVFADSDDYYENNYFENIVPLILKEEIELICFNAYVMNYEDFMHNQINDKYKTRDITNNIGIFGYLRGNYCHELGNQPWNKVYLAKIIKENNLEFDVNKKTGEDLLFNMEYVSYVKNIKYINEKLYYYDLNMNVITTKVYRPKELEELIKYYDCIEKITNKLNINNCESQIGLFYLRRIPGFILNETNNPDYKDSRKKLKEFFTNKRIKNALKKVKLKDFDFKLFVTYVLYVFKLYGIIHYILNKRRNRNNK